LRTRFVVSVVACALFVASCGGSDGEGGGSIEGQDVVVEMYDNRFQYTEIKIPVGGTVNWVGAGRNPHNAVDAGDTWSTESAFGSLDQLEGDEAVLTYDTAGTYVFFCTYHGNADGDGMAGTLIVGEG
jgi:plastocyanin